MPGYQKGTQKGTLQSHRHTNKPWYVLAVDISGRYPDGHYNLLAIDKRKRYPKGAKTHSAAFQSNKEKLK